MNLRERVYILSSAGTLSLYNIYTIQLGHNVKNDIPQQNPEVW